MNINHNNRMSISVHLAAISATLEQLLLHAQKKLRLIGASYLQDGVIGASGTNYITLRLAVDEVAVGADVDTQAGLADRAPLALNLGSLGYIDIEKDEILSLDVTETGTFADGAAAIVSLDIEVIGN